MCFALLYNTQSQICCTCLFDEGSAVLKPRYLRSRVAAGRAGQHDLPVLPRFQEFRRGLDDLEESFAAEAVASFGHLRKPNECIHTCRTIHGLGCVRRDSRNQRSPHFFLACQRIAVAVQKYLVARLCPIAPLFGSAGLPCLPVHLPCLYPLASLGPTSTPSPLWLLSSVPRL